MRFVYGLMGIALLSTGLDVIDNPIWCSAKYQYCADFTGYNAPFGALLVLLGLFILLATLFGKRYTGNDILMCHVCNEPFERKKTANHKCPKCSEELEPLEGFYDRHPELED